jgi:hypothetical protein
LEEFRLHVEVTEKFTDDIKECLQIFNKQTGGVEGSAAPDEWSRWFTDNPYGNGLFSIARDGNRIIGFCSLIPVEMLINKQVIRGAKAEFLFVLPEYRKRKTKNFITPVSVTLLSELYRQSGNFDFELIFGVATKAASGAHLASGMIPMEINLNHYFMLFKPRDFNEFTFPKKTVYKYGTYYLSRFLSTRLNRDLNKDFSFAGSVNELNYRDSATTGKNELLYHSGKMLAFRFKDGDFLIYKTGDNFFILNKPKENERVFLRHWSSNNIDYSSFATVLKDAANGCRAANARSLNLVFSGKNHRHNIDFSRLGFLNRFSTDVLLFYKSNPSLDLSLDASSWYMTDSHRGFI